MGKFNKEHGEHWMSVVGDNYGVDVTHKGNFAHFHMGETSHRKQRFCDLQSCIDERKVGA